MTEVKKRRRRRWRLAVLLCALAVGAGLLYLATTPPPGASIRREGGQLPSGVGLDSPSRLDPTLSRVASDLAGRPTQVRCWSKPDWERHTARLATAFPRLGRLGPWRAYTSRSLRTVNVSPEICAELTALAHGRAPVWRHASQDALAWSVEALAHESQHASGILSEVQANCYGMQSTATAALLLGRTWKEGRYLATAYWKHWYPWLGPSVSSSECRDGGALDLHLGSDVWP